MNQLELRFYPIEGKQDGFKVSVEGSSGEVHCEPVLPFLDGETADAPDRRFTVVKILESTNFNEKNFPEEDEQAWMVREQLLLRQPSAFHPEYLATIGRKLYHILGQRIQQVIETAVAEAKRDRTFLHIRLRFPADDPKYVRLTDYPWELLHNEYGFLAHQGVAFSRYIDYRSPRPHLSSVERLNVLLISSGAGDERMGLKPLPSVERDAIASELQAAQNQGIIQLEILEPPTWKAFRRRLGQRQTAAVPHVLHFDGHGFFGKRCNAPGCGKAYKQSTTQCECGSLLGEPQGYLVFEQSDGTADYISAQELGELLGNVERQEQPNSEQGIVLVVLSGCRTGMSRLSESVFNGVAQNLIGRGIPAVVAMQYSISVPAASAFAEDFYYSLGQKDSLVSALRQGQRAIGIEGHEWYRPVLYLRWEDNDGGQLFDTTQAVERENPPSSSDQGFESQLVPSLITKLTGLQRKQLRVALMSAFPEVDNLALLFEDDLDVPLNQIVNVHKFYEKVIADAIKWAESEGKLSQLIDIALQNKPDNPELKSFVKENLQMLLELDANSLSSEFLSSLIQCLNSITDLASCILPACIQTLPDLDVNHPTLREHLLNDNLSAAVKWLIVLELFLKTYGKNAQGDLYIILFVKNLLALTPDQLALRNWLNQLPGELQPTPPSEPEINSPIRPDLERLKNLQAYFLLMVEPPEITTQTDKFGINCYLISRVGNDNELTNFQAITLQPLCEENSPETLELRQQKQGLSCTLQQIEDTLPDWLLQVQQIIDNRCTELQTNFNLDFRPVYDLTVEFWLPFEHLVAPADTWKIYGKPVRLKRRNLFVGKEHRVVVRSYDRFSDPDALNELNRTWQNLNDFLPASLDTADTVQPRFEQVDCWDRLTTIQRQLVNQPFLGLTLICPLCLDDYQEQRENLFAWILEAGIPMALWSRCSDLADLSQKMQELVTGETCCQLDQLLEEQLLEQIKKTRKLANDDQHLGHHLAIWCDEPKRLIELKQFLQTGRLSA